MWADASIGTSPRPAPAIRRSRFDLGQLIAGGWPLLGLVALVGLLVLVEDDRSGGPLLNFPAFYRSIPGVPVLRISDVLVLLFAAAVVLTTIRARASFRGLGRLTWAIVFLAFGILVGVVAGATSPEADKAALVAAARPLVYLALLPWLVVNVRGRGGWERMVLEGLAALVILKAVLGIAGLLMAPAVGATGQLAITYYQPLSNWLSVLYVLYVVAALAVRAPMPAFVLAGFPLVVTSLTLSYRRSFWLAAVAGLAVIAVAYLSRRGRSPRPDARRGWLGGGFLAAVLLIGFLAFSGSLPSDAVDPVRERALSISTTKIETNRFDSYRIGEQANIVEELRASPIAGLGLGVRWSATKPLSLHFRDAQLYSHLVVTSLWLKLGVLGVIAYLLLIGTGVAQGLSLWARRAPPELAAAGLALAAGLVGLALAETTGSFTGIDLRTSALLGVLLGLALRADGRRVIGRSH